MSYIPLEDMSGSGKTSTQPDVDYYDLEDSNEKLEDNHAHIEEKSTEDEERIDVQVDTPSDLDQVGILPFDASKHITESDYEALLETTKVRVILFGCSGLALASIVVGLILTVVFQHIRPINTATLVSILTNIAFIAFLMVQFLFLLRRWIAIRKLIEFGALCCFHATVLAAVFLNYIGNNDLIGMSVILGSAAFELTFYLFLKFPNGKIIVRPVPLA